MLQSRGSAVLLVFTFFFTFFQDACAFPAVLRRQPENQFDISKYTVPLSDGPSTLPSPSSHLALKAITLARGYQNYTCDPTTSTPPASAGALATLYDATPLLARLCASPHPAQPILNFLTHYLYHFAFPTFLTSSSSSSSKHKDGPADNDGTGAAGIFSIPVLGHHFFDTAHVPTWDLNPRLGVLRGKKTAGIKGTEAGSVDWLVLDGVDGGADGKGKDGGGGGGVGGKEGLLKEVYRVETVGGVVGGECEGKKAGEVVRVRYAAQYWFYG